MTTCTACSGTYSPTLRDGGPYFHACPPLSDAEVIAAHALSVDRTKWSAADAQTFAAASRVRPNARNENVPPIATLQPLIDAVPKTADQTYWSAVNKILATAIVSPGAGSTLVADVQVAPVVGL